MPYFNYCGTVWGNIGIGLADKIQKLQNRAAKILTFSNYEVCSNVLLDELGWERLETSSLKQLAICMSRQGAVNFMYILIPLSNGMVQLYELQL